MNRMMNRIIKNVSRMCGVKPPSNSRQVVVQLQTPGVCKEVERRFRAMECDAVIKCDVTKGMMYRLKLGKNGHCVSITQYKTGKLLLQGLASPLFDKVKAVVDGQK